MKTALGTRIGGASGVAKVGRNHLVAEARSWGLSTAAAIEAITDVTEGVASSTLELPLDLRTVIDAQLAAIAA